MKIVLAVLLVAGSVVFSILYCEFIDCISDDYLLPDDKPFSEYGAEMEGKEDAMP